MMWTKRGRPPLRLALNSILGIVLLSGAMQAESVLNFPRLANQAGTITGVAFVNPNAVEAPIRLTAYGGDGLLIQGAGINNPVDVTVPANQQIGMLTSQLFGNGLPANTVGWFQATSPIDGVTGFFLFLDNAGTLFDGADLPPLDRKIVFNQVRVDGGYTTELNLINTEDLPTRIDLLLFNGDEVLELDPDDIDFTMPARGAVRLDVGTLFGTSPLSEGAYLLVISDTNVGGFEFVRGPTGDLLGLNARSSADYLNTIYFPQLAVRGPWLMEIGVVNYSAEAVSLVITAFDPTGRPFGPGTVARNRVVRVLPGGLALRENVETMFGFTGAAALSGWIQVESTSRAVNGYVTYGVPAVGSVAAVAAVPQPQRRAIFSHIATTRGFFTGVAALNPSASAANVRFVALRQNGQLLGRADRVLGPGERISQLITQLIPQAAGQAGGVIWVSSDIPIHLTSLFGTNTGSVLANIPPQPAPDSYQPDAGLSRLSLSPRFSVLGEGEALQFQAEGTNLNLNWAVQPAPGGPPDFGSIDAAGLYQAPGSLPQSSSVTVRAEAEGLSGSATVDLVAASTFLAGLDNPGALAYLEGSGRLFAAVAAAGAVGSAQPAGADSGRASIVELTAEGTIPIATAAGDDIGGLLPFVAFDGSEYLLASGRVSGRLLRIDPADGQLRQVAAGLTQPGALAYDPLSGSIWVADAAGATRFSRALAESDLVSGVNANGSPPAMRIQATGIAGLAVDGCNGHVYYSLQQGGGEIREFTPEDGSSRQVAGGLGTPGALLGLQRRDSGCGSSFQLLTSVDEAGSLLLVNAAGQEPLPWIAAAGVAGIAFLPADNPLFQVEAVVFTESAGSPAGAPPAADSVAVATVPALYQAGAVNPPESAAGLLADPALDTYNFFEGRVHDIVELTAESDGTDLHISVSFADTISPCEQSPGALETICDGSLNAEDAVAGFIDLDIDQDPLTGLFSFTDANSPYSSQLGAEFCVDFFRYNTAAGGVEIYQSDGEGFVLAGRLPVEFTSQGLSFSIPLSLLGDDGRVNLSAVFGTTFPGLANIGPTDAAPNGGSLRSSVTGQGSAAVSIQQKARAVSRQAARGPQGWKRVLGEFRISSAPR